ncbi:MAG: polysaccharide deacetylase family protein [Ruminococcus sp.]|nr:polysaccharide deacetylase family protein [Ruminococcus sp.]
MKKFITRSLAAAASIALAAASAPAVTSDAADIEPKLIALTFDDGPNTTTTNQVLDILEEYGAKASFFLIGNNITEESAKSVKRAYDMGCEIDNHSKSHSNMGAMSPEDITAEVEFVDEKVMEITGEHTKFFRPPFIDVSQTMYDTIDLPFICGIDCQDYMENVTAQQRADYILSGARDGVIVLLHDAAGNSQTVDALKIVMPELVEQGYEFVTLTELFERQGETPKGNMIYTTVAKYPCSGYTKFRNVFTGKLTGNSSSSNWSESTSLEGAELEKLGSSYAIEVKYDCPDPPVIALQKWSGTAVWQQVQPFYSNGETACFLASDINAALDALDVSYTDLDRITVVPSAMSEMTITSVDVLVSSGETENVKGDVNADGSFNVADLVSLDNYLLGNGRLKNWKAGDLTSDGMISAFDLAEMRVLLGK